MATIITEIPLPSQTEPFLSMTIPLGDATFRLDFRYAQRIGLWRLDVFDSADDPVVRGRLLTAGVDILIGAGVNRPNGVLYLDAPDGNDPGLDLSGVRLFFAYSEAD